MYVEIRARLGVEMPPEEIRSLWVQAFRVDAEVIDIARSIPNKYTTGLLTNNPPILLEALADHLPEISETFNPILFSSELGATKPDVELFDAAALKLAVDPEHIVLIDDSERNATGARRHGWSAIRFLSPEQLVRDLELILG
jgi:putative hydrolase of the HAD superfamily